MKLSWQCRARVEPATCRVLRRALPALLALVGLVAAGCSSAKPSTAPRRSPSASPTSLASPSPSLSLASPSPSPSPSRVPAPPLARPTPSKPPSPAHTGASPAPSPTGGSSVPATIAVPAAGSYTYALSGSYQTPLAPAAQPYPAGASLSTVFTISGTQVTAKVSSPQDNASSSTTWTYGPSAVAITDSTLTYAGLANYDCSYTPPPTALPNPLKVGSLPTASWSSANCSGDVTVGVVDNETVSAAGQTWNVWKVQTTLHYQAESSVNVTATSTVLFSATAGVPITSDTMTTGTVAGQPFSDHQVATLTSLP